MPERPPSEGGALELVAGALAALQRQVDAAGAEGDAIAIADALWLAALRTPAIAPSGEAGDVPVPAPEHRDGPEREATRSDSPRRVNVLPADQPRRELFQRFESPAGVPGTPGQPLLVPPARPLPRSLELTRSLRAFKRPWAIGRASRLDLAATIDGFARSMELIPVFEAAPERWFEAVIIADRSPSMAVWRDTISELRQVVHRTGAFRKIHAWELDTSAGWLTLHGPSGRVIGRDQVRSSDGRRLVLVVSDCAAAWWRDDRAWHLIRDWAAAVPTVLVNPLPPKLWRYMGLNRPAVRVTPAVTAGRSNSALRYQRPLLLGTERRRGEWIPLPVITLTPHSVGRWARMLMRIDDRGCDAILLRPPDLGDGPDEVPPADGADSSTVPGGVRVVGFLHRGSPNAVRLAVLSALLDEDTVDLPLLHLIGEHLVPGYTVSDVAEVIVSGLFTLADDEQAGVTLRFRDGVPRQLRQQLGAHDYWRLREALSRHVATHRATARGFPAIIGDPQGDRTVPSGASAFADVVEPAPVEPAPVEPAPVEPAPVEPAPVEPAPVPGHDGDDERSAPRIWHDVAPRIWQGVPPRNKNFTGRAEIFEQMRHGMTSRITAVLPSQESLPQALQGLGGVGKTAVAIEYAWRYRSDYDLVCWIRADQMPLVRSSLAGLATAVGLDPSVTGIDLTTSGVLDALRRGEPYSRWLLIFDNADQPEELLPFIPSGPGDVLITSRNHRWHSVVETVPLDVFEREESVQFLLKRVLKGLTRADADRLSEKLGDLPLALVQAGALLSEGGMALNEYLRLLEERIVDILGKGTSPEYPTPMTAAWQISVARLRQQSPQALELLRCLAFLGPEPIPRDVLTLDPEESQTGVGDLIADPIDLSTAISTLGRFALIRIDGPYITVHRLIQALLRDDLEPDERPKYRQDVHAMLASSAPGNPTSVSTWPRYADLVAHASSPAADLAHCQVSAHRALALDIMRYLFVSGDFTSCRSLAEQFIAQWTRDSGPDDPHVLDASRHLGNALRELGLASEAFQVVATALNSAERVLGLRAPLTLALRNAFGADLRARGDFSAARDLDEETRLLHEEVFGPADPQTLRVMNNLALDLGLNSDFPAARDLHRDVYVLWRDPREGTPATEVLQSWAGLARAVRLCGNFTQARDLGEDARQYGLHELGPEHHLTLRATIDLSIALRMIPDNPYDALELASEVLEVCKRRRGDRNPDTMAAAISVSNIQRTIGQIDQALQLATSIAEDYPAVYGPDHPYNYGCIGNLALLRRLAGDPIEARRLNEAALAGLDTRLNRNHLFSLTVAVNLASDLAAIGNFSQARAVGEDSLARLTATLGEDHPLTLGCAVNLVRDLEANGAYEEARLLSAKTQSGYRRTGAAENPATSTTATGSRLNFDFDPLPV